MYIVSYISIIMLSSLKNFNMLTKSRGGGHLKFLSVNLREKNVSRKIGRGQSPPPQRFVRVNYFVATRCCTSAIRTCDCMPTTFNGT